MSSSGAFAKFKYQEDVLEEKTSANKQKRLSSKDEEEEEKTNKNLIKRGKFVKEEIGIPPFCAPSPAKYRCRFKSTCESCFQKSKDCEHFKENRLKLLLVGHNPSTHVWANGYNYGNPTNRMWKLLTGELDVGFEGILQKKTPIEKQNVLPSEYFIGLSDIVCLPGNDAGKLSKELMHQWIPDFYGRLKSHVHRVQKNEEKEQEMSSVKEDIYLSPPLIAFTGKRQFQMLYNTLPKETLPFGLLPKSYPLPPNWPFSRKSHEIFILPSSSGRAAMSHSQRIAPYESLAGEYRNLLKFVTEEEEEGRN